jgi:hypothetical protein
MSHRKTMILSVLFLFAAMLISSSADAGRRVRTFGSPSEDAGESEDKKSSKDDTKPFAKMIKDKVVVEGLFTFYQDTTDNTWLMAIAPEQFGPIYLCGQTRSKAAGAFYDNGSMGRSFPFYLKQVGENIQIMEKNLRFRADTSSALSRALDNAISDHLWAVTAVKSKPDDSTKAILIDVSDLFVRDIQNTGYFVGSLGKTGVKFDEKNSYFEQIKSFPENCEIDVRMHFKSSKPLAGQTLQNKYSFYHLYHYSLSSIPESDYVPRIGDDRVGHFMTIYQDYTDLDVETPYVRYIDRWHLKKSDSTAELSEPVEPIVFWIDNAVPEEYRQACEDAVVFWNPSFEKIGFKNALVAKQMPDTADWDPADVRYNVIRWMVAPGAAYAVGPSRANPFTGEIYDADIRFSVDWIRFMYNQLEYFIQPLAFDGSSLDEVGTFGSQLSAEYPDPANAQYGHAACNYGLEAAEDAAFAMSYLDAATDDMHDKDSIIQRYVNTYITEILAHEVGHTLGFRHNFKASTIYTWDQITDPAHTEKYGTSGTIMDYMPPIVAGPDRVQGDFYSSIPGPYDDWMTEYAYSEFGATHPNDEIEQLEQIASKAGRPDLVYGTDSDALRWSTRSIDPHCNLHDLSDDPLFFAEHKVKLTRELWGTAVSRFEQEGDRYQKILRAFQSGWRSYREMALIGSKYVGGIYHYNHHVSDSGGKIPYVVVPAAEQRRAVAYLSDYLFAADAFDLPAALLNRLQPEQLPDFIGSVYRQQIDYPIHQRVMSVQAIALVRLYSPDILGRLVNNEERYNDGDDVYTMYDLFTEVRRSIWGEVVKPSNVNSFRRQLQLSHLRLITNLYLSGSTRYPADARSLAGNDLEVLLRATRNALSTGGLDDISRAHFKEVIRQIEASQEARRVYRG